MYPYFTQELFDVNNSLQIQFTLPVGGEHDENMYICKLTIQLLVETNTHYNLSLHYFFFFKLFIIFGFTNSA